MYDDEDHYRSRYRSRSRSRDRDRDAGSYRDRSPPPRWDDGGDQYRSRKGKAETPGDASRISVMAPTRTADMGFDSRGRADAHGEHDSHGVLDNRLAGRVDVPMGGGEYPETVPLAGNPGPSTAFPPPGSRGRAVVDGTRPGRRSPELPYDDEDSHYPRDLPGGGSQGPARPGLYRSSPDSHRRLVPRSPSPLGRMGGGAHRPTSTVILEGLPAAVLEDDILDGFSTASGPSVFRAEDVKAVRLRNNKRGRRIGFVEFYRVADAEEFVEYHYPSLEFNLAHSRGVDSEPITVGINYSRGREDDNRDDRDRGRDGDEWTCRECAYSNYGYRTRCYKCSSDRQDGHRRGRDDGYGASSGPRLTGETDECPQQFPSQYLVIRGLEPSVNEEVLAKGIKKLFVETTPETKKETTNKLKSTAPTANTASMGARPDSLRRVFLVRDRGTDSSLRYGFAEFTTLEDAQGAVAKFRASPKFTISSKPITVAFIHTGVFVPHNGRITDENSRFIFHPVYNQDLVLKYWDTRVYPSILDVFVGSHSSGGPSPETAADSPKASMSAAEDSIATVDSSGKKIKKFKVAQPATAASIKNAIAMNPQMQMWAKKRAELVGKRKAESDANDDSTHVSLDPNNNVCPSRTRSRVSDTYTSFGDVDALSCMLCMRKFATELALRDHQVLNKDHIASVADEEKRKSAITRLDAKGKAPQTITIRITRAPANTLPIYTSYADRENLHCLVCQRKFTTSSHLSLHERESEMHRTNMEVQANIDRAISQLASTGKTPTKMVPSKTKGPQYRDRAKERRQAYNQPKQPSGPKKDRPAKAVDAEEAPAPKPAAPSKGAALLGKMGWSAGEGLGAEGTGRTDVIATDVYAAGVGLGAEGSKLGDAATEAARKTAGQYSDFVAQTKDKARARFEKLG